jgi:alanine racemase
MQTTSVIELNRKALAKNICILKEYIGNEVLFSSVVKGNAYGHGIEVFIPLAQKCGIKHFSAFSADEAFRVYNSLQRNAPIMIMGWISDDELEWVIKTGIEFYVFEVERFVKAIEIAKKLRIKAKIHLEIETGMNRTGIKPRELRRLLRVMKLNTDHFIFSGLCTHYAGAESIANHVRVQKQYRNYNNVFKWFFKNGFRPLLRHTASSAAAITYPKTRMDMVRVGILQYGFWPGKETLIHYLNNKEEKTDPLERVISWKSKVMSLKDVNQGEFVSYGTTYFTTEEKRVAIIPVGYAHGYSRSLSNQGRVLINGQRVAVIGMVNMNMILADVTYLPDVKIGDEVVIIGEQDGNTLSVASFAEISEQVNYELLARLPESINRILTN